MQAPDALAVVDGVEPGADEEPEGVLVFGPHFERVFGVGVGQGDAAEGAGGGAGGGIDFGDFDAAEVDQVGGVGLRFGFFGRAGAARGAGQVLAGDGLDDEGGPGRGHAGRAFDRVGGVGGFDQGDLLVFDVEAVAERVGVFPVEAAAEAQVGGADFEVFAVEQQLFVVEQAARVGVAGGEAEFGADAGFAAGRDGVVGVVDQADDQLEVGGQLGACGVDGEQGRGEQREQRGGGGGAEQSVGASQGGLHGRPPECCASRG